MIAIPHRSGWLVVVVLSCVLPIEVASAQTPNPADGPWAGWIRCQVTAQGQGYSDQQTHTWIMSGGAPRVEGVFRIYPATWSVVGGGSLQRTQGANIVTAQWATNGQAPSAPIAVFTRGDGRLVFTLRHDQLRAASGFTGYRFYTVDGKRQPIEGIAAETYEYRFQAIDDSSATKISGSSTLAIPPSNAFTPQPGSTGSVSCAWQFGVGAAAPAPPPPLQAQATPTPPPVGTSAPTLPAGTVAGSSQPTPTVAPVPGFTLPGGSLVVTGPSPSPGGGTAAIPSGPTLNGEVLAGTSSNGTLTAVGGSTTTSAPPVGKDPGGFTATQIGDGTVQLKWNAVTGVSTYILGGPGAGNGVQVTATTYTVTGIPAGPQTWTVASMPVLTTFDTWPRASATIVNHSGKYRIVLTGFRVTHGTSEDALRVDGLGDEVFPSAKVEIVDRTGKVLSSPIPIQGLIHGDTSVAPNRIRAGSAGTAGGLQQGDVVPAGSDPGQLPTGQPSPVTFPFNIWEGTLTDGGDAVVIRPVLWEWDGDPSTYNVWVQRWTPGNFRYSEEAGTEQAAIKSKLDSPDLSPYIGTRNFFCTADILKSTLIFDVCKRGTERPIGINRMVCPGNNQMDYAVWCNPTIVVTREAVEKAYASTSQTGGVAPGVIPIHLLDGPEFAGTYELYVAIQRLP